MMKQAYRKGLGFGLTSGVITTLGIIIGLYSSTQSRVAIITGIAIIAVADSLSDALGMHISEESEKNAQQKNVWISTFSTLTSKMFFALTFILPFIFLEMNIAVITSILWGLALISWFSAYIAKKNEKHKVILEHLAITILVIVLTHTVGKLASILV